MRKKLLSTLCGVAALCTLNAQPYVKHYTEADTAGVNTAWTANATFMSWALTKCADTDEFYALFSIDMANADADTVKAGSWVTDIKFDNTADANFDWANVQENLYVNFWANTFDGVNKGDSINLCFELNDIGGKHGWPSRKCKPGANEWAWVSVQVSDLDFGGAVPADIPDITLIKFSTQPAKDYVKSAGGTFKLAIQDITISEGPAPKPANAPCYKGTAVKNANTAALKFYPNPVVNQINFNMPASGQLVDVTGKVVLKFSNATQVNVESLANGIYFMKANNITSKVIIK